MEGGTHEKAHYPLHYAHLDIYLGDFCFGRKPACAAHPAENIQTGVTEQMVAALTKAVPHISLHPQRS